MANDLKPAPKKRRFIDRILGTDEAPAAAVEQVRDPEALRALIRSDRVRRRMTWPVYAKFLGMSVSTIYKIATGVHTPTEITEAVIREKLAKTPSN